MGLFNAWTLLSGLGLSHVPEMVECKSFVRSLSFSCTFSLYCFKRVGRNVKSYPLGQYKFEEIEPADKVPLHFRAFCTSKGIKTGKRALFKPRVMVQAGQNVFRKLDRFKDQYAICPRNKWVRGIVIGRHVWGGANDAAFDGSWVVSGSVVAVGRVVAGSIVPNSIADGVSHLVSRLEVGRFEDYQHLGEEVRVASNG